MKDLFLHITYGTIFFVLFPFSCFAENRFGIPEIIDLGQVKAGGTKEFRIPLENKGKGAITIKRVSTSCGCTVVDANHRSLGSGQLTTIKGTFSAGRYAGKRKKTVYVYLDGKDVPVACKVTAYIKGPPKAKKIKSPPPPKPLLIQGVSYFIRQRELCLTWRTTPREGSVRIDSDNELSESITFPHTTSASELRISLASWAPDSVVFKISPVSRQGTIPKPTKAVSIAAMIPAYGEEYLPLTWIILSIFAPNLILIAVGVLWICRSRNRTKRDNQNG